MDMPREDSVLEGGIRLLGAVDLEEHEEDLLRALFLVMEEDRTEVGDSQWPYLRLNKELSCL
jgi:hypothetical protein